MSPRILIREKRKLFTVVLVVMLIMVSFFVGRFTNQTPTTSPSAASYTIWPEGGVYYAKNATGYICWSSKNPSTVFTKAIASGENIAFQTGTYSLSSSFAATSINNVTLNFANGAILFVGNGMNAPAIYLISCNNWVINGPTINGNAVNQANINSGSDASGTKQEGISFSNCNNCLVNGANIFQARQFGFVITGTGSVIGSHDGIINSKITSCNWNCIQLGTESHGVATNLYAINNECTYSSDVGISIQGTYCIVQNNDVHDINGTTGFNSANWGIAVEYGNNNMISGNTVQNGSLGILVNGFDFCTVSGNTVSGSTGGGCYIGGKASYNAVENNYFYDISSTDPAISLSGSSVIGNSVTKNYIYYSSVSGNTAIQLCSNGVASGNTISQNTIVNATIGIKIFDSFVTSTVLSGNIIQGTTTAINDSGTYTVTNPLGMQQITVGATVTAGEFLYQSTSNGEYYPAKADTIEDMGETGVYVTALAITGTNSGGQCTIITGGIFTDPSWSWTTAESIFASASLAGSGTQTAPSSSGNVIENLGSALSSTQINFNPQTGSVIVHT